KAANKRSPLRFPRHGRKGRKFPARNAEGHSLETAPAPRPLDRALAGPFFENVFRDGHRGKDVKLDHLSCVDHWVRNAGSRDGCECGRPCSNSSPWACAPV